MTLEFDKSSLGYASRSKGKEKSNEKTESLQKERISEEKN